VQAAVVEEATREAARAEIDEQAGRASAVLEARQEWRQDRAARAEQQAEDEEMVGTGRAYEIIEAMAQDARVRVDPGEVLAETDQALAQVAAEGRHAGASDAQIADLYSEETVVATFEAIVAERAMRQGFSLVFNQVGWGPRR
jgi:hypothetical protein